jgi:arylsulfatase A-like enzyme
VCLTMTQQMKPNPAALRVWLTIYTLAASFFVGMEWLFFATKPSFLSVLTWGNCLWVLALAVFPLVGAGCAVLLGLSGAMRLLPARAVRIACLWSMRALPTLVLAASGLLLVDNFTTTLFRWGIASLGRGRVPYAAAALIGVIGVWWLVGRWAAGLRARPIPLRVASALAATVVALTASGAALELAAPAGNSHTVDTPTHRPDILLIGLDGVNAEHLSLYGYRRGTSPSLTMLADRALVFTNAYSNAGNTGGALTAILTGRLPTATRVIFAPDILRGDAARLHLPGILQALGYRTGQFVVRHYGAAIDFNMRGGFDIVNGRSVGPQALVTRGLLAVGQGGYLLDQILWRVRSRVEALAGRREASAFEEVNEPLAAQYMDTSRMRQLRAFIEETRQPLFAHAHLMVTHGDRFAPRERRFSAGQEQTAPWMSAFYDDAILDADRSIGEIVTLLRQRGSLDRTLFVIYSDHTQGFRTDRPVPLIVRLPGGARRGRVGETVQTIDIAPTILDALGLRPAPWMTGQSLLRRIPPCRPIYGAMAARRAKFRGRDYTIPAPPFFGLGVVSLVRGSQWFFLSVEPPSLSGGKLPLLPGAAADCAPLTREEAHGLLLTHLRTAGYELRGTD